MRYAGVAIALAAPMDAIGPAKLTRRRAATTPAARRRFRRGVFIDGPRGAAVACTQVSDTGAEVVLMGRSLPWSVVLAMGVAVARAVAAGPESPATVTILEGEAVIVHGTSRLAAASGVQLQPDDLLESAKATFTRLEFDDGTRIDVGPGTRLQLSHPSGARGERPALYLLSGWVKLSPGEAKLVPPLGLASPVVDAGELTGNLVAHVDGAAAEVFLEQGRVRCRFRAGHAPVVLKGGDFLAVGRDGKVGAEPRPSPDFIGRLPAAFRDSIPPQLARFKGRAVQARALGEFSYAQVQDWLNAEPSVRQQFVTTWKAKADEPDFRLALSARLNEHPEWGPVLFPELFGPGGAKLAPPAAPTSVPVPAPAPAPAPKGDSGAM